MRQCLSRGCHGALVAGRGETNFNRVQILTGCWGSKPSLWSDSSLLRLEVGFCGTLGAGCRRCAVGRGCAPRGSRGTRVTCSAWAPERGTSAHAPGCRRRSPPPHPLHRQRPWQSRQGAQPSRVGLGWSWVGLGWRRSVDGRRRWQRRRQPRPRPRARRMARRTAPLTWRRTSSAIWTTCEGEEGRCPPTGRPRDLISTQS